MGVAIPLNGRAARKSSEDCDCDEHEFIDIYLLCGIAMNTVLNGLRFVRAFPLAARSVSKSDGVRFAAEDKIHRVLAARTAAVLGRKTGDKRGAYERRISDTRIGIHASA